MQYISKLLTKYFNNGFVVNLQITISEKTTHVLSFASNLIKFGFYVKSNS